VRRSVKAVTLILNGGKVLKMDWGKQLMVFSSYTHKKKGSPIRGVLNETLNIGGERRVQARVVAPKKTGRGRGTWEPPYLEEGKKGILWPSLPITGG